MIEPLGPEARALLDAARAGLSPDAAAVRRVHARIAAGAGAAGATAGTTLAVKLGVVALIAAIAAAGWIHATRGARQVAPAERTRLAPSIPVPPPVEPGPQAAAGAPSGRQLDDEQIEIEPNKIAVPAAAAPPRRIAPSRRAPVAPASPAKGLPAASLAEPERAAPTPAPPSTIDLAREVELLDLALAALHRGDLEGAVDATRRHATETRGRGQLAEDAAAIEIEALCRLHDPDATTRLAAFDARFPRSAQWAKLHERCP